MDKFIGIITAEEKENDAIKDEMTNIEEVNEFNLKIIKGKIEEKQYLLVRSGIGKVNAARVTQILIDKFNIEYIINVGSAGAINDTLEIGDIVVGKELVQYDFNLTAFGRKKGEIPDTGRFFKSEESLVEKCKKISINNINIVTGIISSGDIFCKDIELKNHIKEEFNADCVEMEGAAIAQVCFLNNVPFIIIRSISDIPNGKNQIDFNKYLDYASKNCVTFIKELSKMT